MEEAIAEMKEALLEGLTTDGAHHKQYSLEQALLHLVGSDEYSKLIEEHRWEGTIDI